MRDVHDNSGARPFEADRYQPPRLAGVKARRPWRARAEAALAEPFPLNSFTAPHTTRSDTLRSLLENGLHGPWWGTSGPTYRRVFQRWSNTITEDFGPRTTVDREEAKQLGENLRAVADVIEQHFVDMRQITMEERDRDRMGRMITHLRDVSRALTELSWAIHPRARVDLSKPLVTE
ncbi:MAG: hypothetical protein RIT81_27125 [Deltaproteobacteria bacterium]